MSALTRDQRAALDEAVEKWIGEGVRHNYALRQSAVVSKLIPFHVNSWQAFDALHTSLQRLRKRGVIEFVGGAWRRTS